MPSSFINPVSPGTPEQMGGVITSPEITPLAEFVPPTPAQAAPFFYAGDDVRAIMAGDWIPLI